MDGTYDPERDVVAPRRAGIDIKDGSHDVTVHHNVVRNVNTGIYMDARGDMRFNGSIGSISTDNTLQADPLFVAPGNGSADGFRLQPSSPACSYGTTDGALPHPDEDFEGAARSHVGAGAFTCP